MYSMTIDMIPSAIILARDFETLGGQLKSFKEPLKRSIQQVISPSIGQNFAEGGRPSWLELADGTVADKSRKGYGGQAILVRSGNLKKTAQQLNIWTIDGPGGEASVSSLPDKVWYGMIQDGGGEAGHGSFIPSRPFMMMQPEDIDNVATVFEDYFNERIDALF